LNSKPQRISRQLHYTFQAPRLLETALTHRSASHKHNERLEFLGDGLLNCVVASLLFKQFPDADEGVLSRYRATLVKESSLAKVALAVNLGECLYLGPGEMKSGGVRRESILADCLEALFGAIYLDGGYAQCHEVVERLFKDQLLRLADITDLKDPKTRLQEYLQSKRLPLPEYQLIKISGQAHSRHFLVECRTDLTDASQGEGSSRRAAEQAAAEQTLRKLND